MQMVNVTLVPAANMTLTFDGGHAIGVVGPAQRCKASLTAIANVTGPANATSPPTGNVTLAVTNPDTSLILVHLVIVKVCACPCTAYCMPHLFVVLGPLGTKSGGALSLIFYVAL